MEVVNEAWLEYRNATREEVIGKSCIEEMHAEDVKMVKKAIDQAFDKKKEFSLQYRIKEGRTYKLLLSKGKPNYSHDGRFIGFTGFCVEIPTPRNLTNKAYYAID